MNDFNLIMENWRAYLEEVDAGEPTVNDFLQAMAKSNGKLLKKVLGVTSKVVAGIAAGALVSAGSAAVAGTAAVAGAAAVVGGAGAALGEEAIGQIMSKISDKAPILAKWMHNKLIGGVPDDERTPIDHYFDIDDELEAVIKGGAKNSPLFKKFADELYKIHLRALASIDQENDIDKPLKDFIAGTADQYLQRLLARGFLGDEFKGVVMRKAATQS
jgi:hypothetical protein